MKEHVEKRLAELRQEREKGERMLAELAAKHGEVKETLLRVSGAIQVLEEVLKADPPAWVAKNAEPGPTCPGEVEPVYAENRRGDVVLVGTASGMALPQQEQTTRDAVLAQMRALPELQRAYVITSFCRCGSANLKCQCWNDE